MTMIFHCFRCLPLIWVVIPLFFFSLMCTFLSYYGLREFRFDLINNVEAVKVEEIVGDVYHSAEIFRMNYAEMEKDFKIYLYPDGDYMNNKHLISGWYASEGYFSKNLRESSFVTDDPDRAHLFFIPISCCHKLQQQVASYKEIASKIGKYLGIIYSYPFWNRTLGADHFFVSCHEVDIEATVGVPRLIKNSIRIACSPTYNTVGYFPHKDVSLPSVMYPFPKPAGRGHIHNRTILGYWAGNCNSALRNKLVKLWGKDQELDIQNTTFYKAGRMQKFYGAKFCICPAGSRVTTSRIMMAIRYGCVPVILADYLDLPFSNVLDWQKFSIILKESDVYRLKDILRAKEVADFRMLHNNLVKAQRHFQWNTPPVKYDAFHMVMYDLWLRRHVVRY
ncbi:Acetylglucosaminyltransferase EXT1/exostosin 1 [Handroanthus impetiginosus]|uniref:Acetylglucosaminyltransferase EXT1/exostosin 1 n=1 Tax=Handroanthus impetiginosus TaxID=429701 RepID=A0A2G9HMI9_9LAMI|nr:Acetylglucosaminyltransferase EXT1/exostosin 1 [Handroanthus impetiginosus]